jgi:hypothetical protein
VSLWGQLSETASQWSVGFAVEKSMVLLVTAMKDIK